MRKLQILGLLLTLPFWLQAQNIQSPSQFLGYQLGDAFTYHHDMLDYFQHVATNSGKVQVAQYGKTYERRKLIVAYISSEANIKNLEQIRKNNLIASGLEDGTIEGKQIPIVWLSYNVHGNEAVSMEAAMKVIHDLVGKNALPDAEKWLENMVIVIDPCENPDGRDRYANWYNQAKNKMPNANPDAWEHYEPWPNGRYNHYNFDLNRDWAWQTQIESQTRTKLYRKWMPQVHVDLHEMSPNASYFFPPSAEPFHQTMTQWQRDFHQLAGKSHSKYFDKEGWLYFTSETYDLFYPSYGDTWPTFNGAMGFTYEQGGSGRAGLGIHTNEDDTLTLKNRIAHHYTSSISTIDISFQQKEKLIEQFNTYFKEGMSKPSGAYTSYVIKASNNPKSVKALLTLLDNQGIKYGYANKGKNSGFVGFDYLKNGEGSFSLSDKDIVVSAFQPRHHFVEVLFDPDPKLSDSLTYDMTAWALPYVYGLEAYATKQRIDVSNTPIENHKLNNILPEGNSFAYLAEWNDTKDVKFLASIIQKGIKVRVSEKAFKLDEKNYEPGTLIITRKGNEHISDGLGNTLVKLANKHQVRLTFASSGMVEAGKDFGSEHVRQLKQLPKVATINGDGISATAFGEVWHYFEQVIEYPVTVLNTNNLKYIDLKNYDVIVLASGNYREFTSSLAEFVQNGGKLIMLDASVQPLKGSGLSRVKLDEEEESLLKVYGERTRKSVMDNVEGSIFRVYLDKTHPLAFGLRDEFFIAKKNNRLFSFLENGWNVGHYKEDSHIAGFVGSKLKPKIPNTLAIGVENVGSGTIIYMPDSPIFRGFWHSGMLLMGNAIFLVE